MAEGDPSWLPVLSFTAVSSTIALFLCGIPICRRIKEKETTDGTSGAPFLVASLSCALWLQYGFVRHDKVVIFVNGVGCVLQFLYLAFYYSYTFGRQKRSLKQVIFLETVAGGIVEYLVNYGGLADGGESILGAVCVVLNVVNIAAPLAALGEVIRAKSSESLPFPLCLANLLVSLQWFVYGTTVVDRVIQVPNAISIVLSLLQLSLFLVYPSTGKGAPLLPPKGSLAEEI